MILVDPIKTYETHLRYKNWCHMVSDTSEEELHAFAAKIGLKRNWFQSKSRAHYDLTPTKRDLAVMFGAQEVTSKELVQRNWDSFEYYERKTRAVTRASRT